MNSQIMENVIQYYLHVHDSALRIYSQNKSEYRTANYLYCGQNNFCSVSAIIGSMQIWKRRCFVYP